MIWHQLCFLDIRVCEAQSPRARIRKDDFDTKFPLNVEDSELEKSDLSIESIDKWTSMAPSNARMECNEKIREIYAARQRTRQEDKSKLTYIKKMLEMIHDFQQYMEKKYHPMIDDGIPIQRYTRLVIKLHCRRMHGIVLHEYHMSTPRGRMPGEMLYPLCGPLPLLTITSSEQLSRTVIKSGLETMEVAKEIETSDDLRPWRWYAGALQQHSFATLILIEVFGFPRLDYAKRAWESLDWIFQVPSCVPLTHKGRWVLEGAVGVMKEYLKARKLRCPTFMDERLEITPSSIRKLTLSQVLTMSDTGANSQGTSMDSDGQATMKHEMIYKNADHVCTGRVGRSILGVFSCTDCSTRSPRLVTYPLLHPIPLNGNGVPAKEVPVHLALLTSYRPLLFHGSPYWILTRRTTPLDPLQETTSQNLRIPQGEKLLETIDESRTRPHSLDPPKPNSII